MKRLRILDWFFRRSRVSQIPTLLSREEYLDTFSGKNISLPLHDYDLTIVWQYVARIPRTDHRGYAIAVGDVQFVYRTQNGEFEHVLVSTKTPNAFVVIIVQVKERSIIGHHLLDLNFEYGIENA